MLLAELSTAERRYLSSPVSAPDTWSPMLVRHMSRLLGARLKQGVQIQIIAPEPGSASDNRHATEAEIGWNDVLERMWLQARLGGPGVMSGARCTAMRHNLMRTLQLGVAESWISMRNANSLPAILSLRVGATRLDTNQHAEIVIDFPASATQMTQWAQRIIRHEN